MYLLGLTGGIASGKSTVSNLLEKKYKIPVIDADKIARKVVEKGTRTLHNIVKAFGPDIIDSSTGELNRSKLAEIIFNQPEARQKLNKLTHPVIVREMIRQTLWHYLMREPLVVLDVPLLFESTRGLLKWFNDVCVVYSLKSVQTKRLIARDSINEEQATVKISAQIPLEEKRDQCTILIDNSGSLERTEDQVAMMFSYLPTRKSMISNCLWVVSWVPVFLCWSVLTIMNWRF